MAVEAEKQDEEEEEAGVAVTAAAVVQCRTNSVLSHSAVDRKTIVSLSLSDSFSFLPFFLPLSLSHPLFFSLFVIFISF